MIEHALVVAPDRSTASTLERLLGDLGIDSVTQAWSSEQALEAVTQGVEAAFVFASVYDGLPLRVVRAARRASPAPKVMWSAKPATRTCSHWLGRARWLTSPGRRIRTGSGLVWRTSEPAPSSLEDGVRSLVGRVGMKDALGWLRKTMLQEALLASNGSRRATARILGVTTHHPANVARRARRLPACRKGRTRPRASPRPRFRARARSVRSVAC